MFDILKIKNIKICVNTLGSRSIFKVFPIRLEYLININQIQKIKTVPFAYFAFLGRNQRSLTFSFMSVHVRLSNDPYWHRH